MGHSGRKLLWDTLVGHSCGTLLWDTLIGHSCGTLLWDPLVGHSCGTLLWDTLVGHSCETLLWDTLVGHSCRTLLWDTLVGLSSSFPDTPRTKVVLQGRQFSASSSPDTPRTTVALQGRQFSASSSTDCSAHSSGTTKSPVLACISRARHARSPQRVARAPDKSHSRLHFAHSTRTISAEGCVRMGQIALAPAFRALDAHDLRRGLRAHGSNRALACISHTRHARSPQRVARQVSKTSVSYETSSKTHTSKSAKRAFRTRLPPKVKRKHPSEHTHHAALPGSFAIPAPPNNIRSQCDSDIHLYTTTQNLTILCACHESFPIHTSNAHKVLRLPRNVTSLTPRNLTIPCACHENRTSTPQKPHEVLRLPRKVTISSHVSFNKICTTPHVWNDFDPFRAHSHPPKSPFQLRLVTKTELRCHTLKRKSQWHGHIQHPKNTTLQTLIPMALRSKLRISQNAAPVQRNASRFLRDMSVSCKSQWNSGAN